MKVKLYTVHCPKCNVLEKKLLKSGIEFSVIDDTEEMINLGFMQSPILKVDEIIMDFTTANSWLEEVSNHKRFD